MYVDYIGIIPLLVNAISELNNKVDSLECIIQEQNVTSPISNLRKKEVKKTEDIEDVIYKDCELYQNAPNPFLPRQPFVVRYPNMQNQQQYTCLIFKVDNCYTSHCTTEGMFLFP